MLPDAKRQRVDVSGGTGDETDQSPPKLHSRSMSMLTERFVDSYPALRKAFWEDLTAQEWMACGHNSFQCLGSTFPHGEKTDVITEASCTRRVTRRVQAKKASVLKQSDWVRPDGRFVAVPQVNGNSFDRRAVDGLPIKEQHKIAVASLLGCEYESPWGATLPSKAPTGLLPHPGASECVETMGAASKTALLQSMWMGEKDSQPTHWLFILFDGSNSTAVDAYVYSAERTPVWELLDGPLIVSDTGKLKLGDYVTIQKKGSSGSDKRSVQAKLKLGKLLKTLQDVDKLRFLGKYSVEAMVRSVQSTNYGNERVCQNVRCFFSDRRRREVDNVQPVQGTKGSTLHTFWNSEPAEKELETVV